MLEPTESGLLTHVYFASVECLFQRTRDVGMSDKLMAPLQAQLSMSNKNGSVGNGQHFRLLQQISHQLHRLHYSILIMTPA